MSSYSERFSDALSFAHDLHRKQRRKTSGVPYVAHLLGVAALVIEDGGGEDEAIAALLHDALEDQSYHYPGGRDQLAADIGSRFGPEVRRIVEACTERRGRGARSMAEKRAGWRDHRLGYIGQILSADAAVRRVSAADSLHNVRSMTKDYLSMGDEIWSRFLTRSRDDQLWAYDALARALVANGTAALARELDRAVDELYRATGVRRPAAG